MSTAIPYQSIQTQSHEFQLDELNQPFLDNQNNDNDNDSDNDNDNNQDDDSNDNEYRTKQEKVEEGDDSAETVQRVVPRPSLDDPTLPAFTFRVFIIGTLLCLVGASYSQLAFFKTNAVSFSSFFIILLSYPMGWTMHKLLPDRTFTLLGTSFSLNPGPFNKKEHLLISVLAGSGSNASYAGEVLSVQSLFYKQELGRLPGLILLISSQALGFGLSGATNSLLVRPTKMVWPSTLVFVTLFETLHSNSTDLMVQSYKSDQMKFFVIAFVAIFIYQFLPSVIFPTLTSFATLCMISNASSVLRIIGSGYDGFGMFNFSLDWSVIGGTAPLFTPFFANANFYFGLVVSMWFIVPLLYFTNFWDAKSFDSPLGASLYEHTSFARFKIVNVITSPQLSLNQTAFDNIKPILLTPYFAISYGVSFAVLTSALATVALFHSTDIKNALLGTGEADVHVQALERNYEPIPNSWYATIFFVNLAAATSLVHFYPELQLSVTGLLLAVAISIFFLVPCGIIAAITNTTIGLNVVTEFIAGYLYPGLPIANIVFKVFGYMTMVQSIDLSSDLKLGLYSKIAPKAMLIAQLYGTTLGAIVNHTLIRGVIASKRPFLDGTQIDPTGQYTGRSPQIFFSASVIWGLIGPQQFFEGKYRVLYWGFLIGFILPFVPWVMSRRNPKSKIWRNISIPLILHGSIAPPQLPTNIIISGFAASFASQYYALRYQTKWFDKYNYVLSSALDAGTSINALSIYAFGISSFATWWGNSSIDSEHCRLGS